MIPILLTLGAAFGSPYPADLPARLDAPSFAVRARADGQLRASLTWAGALRLERDARTLGPEGQRRAALILNAYWRGWWPALVDTPHIDAMDQTTPPCCGAKSPLSRSYLTRAVKADGEDLRKPYRDAHFEFRLATRLMLEDLYRLRVPPEWVRPLLVRMDRETKAWERRNHFARPAPLPER